VPTLGFGSAYPGLLDHETQISWPCRRKSNCLDGQEPAGRETWASGSGSRARERSRRKHGPLPGGVPNFGAMARPGRNFLMLDFSTRRENGGPAPTGQLIRGTSGFEGFEGFGAQTVHPERHAVRRGNRGCSRPLFSCRFLLPYPVHRRPRSAGGGSAAPLPISRGRGPSTTRSLGAGTGEVADISKVTPDRPGPRPDSKRA